VGHELESCATLKLLRVKAFKRWSLISVGTAGFNPAIVQVASEVTRAIGVATEMACLHSSTTDPWTLALDTALGLSLELLK